MTGRKVIYSMKILQVLLKASYKMFLSLIRYTKEDKEAQNTLYAVVWDISQAIEDTEKYLRSLEKRNTTEMEGNTNEANT